MEGTNELMNKWGLVVGYMDYDIREWVYSCYEPCSEEEFLNQYVQRYLYENGQEMFDKHEAVVFDATGIMIGNYASYEAKQNALYEGGWECW